MQWGDPGLLRSGDAEALHLPPEGGLVDAEVARRSRAVPAVSPEGRDEELRLGVLERERFLAVLLLAREEAGRKMPAAYRPRPAHHEGMFYRILEFADVARVVVTHEECEGVRRDARYLLRFEMVEALYEVVDEKRDVLTPFTQRRDVDRNDVDAVEEVASELLGLDSSPQPRGRPRAPCACRRAVRTCHPAVP